MGPMKTSRTKTIRLDASRNGAVEEAAAILRAGGTVAFPTETVYGLGGDATDPVAVARIYEAKGRPSFNPLIAHVAHLEEAEKHGLFDETAQRLATAFWPGPLTLVLPLRESSPICELARAGFGTVGLRMPSHRVARALIAAADRPIAGPSANRSGHVSPTSAEHVLADLDGRIDAVLDAGPTQVGIESTIVSVIDGTPRLLRAGGITRQAIEQVLGRALGAETEQKIAPGMMASHYAPQARVRLDAENVEPGEAVLSFGAAKLPGLEGASLVLDLSPSGDLVEAAANLFSHLRALDASGAPTIAVAPIPAEGLGEAIHDRLMRSAAPRPVR